MTDSTNYITQLPGELNINMVDDNDLVFSVNWNMDINNYVFTGSIIPEDGTAEIPMVVDIIDPDLGLINVTVTVASILNLLPGVHSWYLDWTTPAPDNFVRTVLAGVFALRAK